MYATVLSLICSKAAQYFLLLHAWANRGSLTDKAWGMYISKRYAVHIAPRRLLN